MRGLVIRFMEFVLVWVLACLPVCVHAASPAQGLSQALDELHTWLGDDEKGLGWKTFLHSEELQAELEKEENVDAAVLEKILAVYSSDTPGLEKRRFQAVNRALQLWRDDLFLLQIIGSAKDDFVPFDPNQLTSARTKLVDSIDKLDRWLQGGGQKKNQGWRTFLLWDDLQQTLQRAEGPELDVLRRVGGRFVANQSGLDRKRFRNVRDALGDYVDALTFSGDDFQQQYESQIDALAAALTEFSADPTHKNTSEIALRMHWMKRAGQGDRLLRVLTSRFAHPNFVVRASEKLVVAGVSRQISREEPIREVILGTRIRGMGTTEGQVTGQFVPNSTAAQLDIIMTGTMRSKSRGYNGPVTIHTTGVTQIHGSKRLFFDADGLRDEPATADCSTSTSIHNISAGILLQQFAENRARTSKRRAESIASRQAERRVAQRMDDESKTEIDETNAEYRSRFNERLTKHNIYPTQLDFSTTSDYLLVNMQYTAPLQLGVDTSPPAINAQDDLAVCVHESWFNNNAETLLAGKTFDAQRTSDLVESLTGSIPEGLLPAEEDEPWTITFHRRHPISVKFANQTVQVTLRSRRFTSADRRVKPMHTTVIYRVEQTPEATKLVMEGEIDVVPADFHTRERKTLSAAETAERAVLKRRLEKMFETEIELEAPELPDDWAGTGELHLEHLKIDGGWLQASWMQR